MSPKNKRSEEFFSTGHLTASLGGRTARGGFVTMVTHGLKFIVSIAATAVLARLLTPQDYGLIGMVAVVTSFVSMFKDLGLSFATVQRAEISADQVSTLFWVNVGLSVLITLVMVIFAPGVSWFYGDSRLTAITIVTAGGFILGGLAVQHEALLKRQMRFFALSFAAFVSMTFGYLAGIILAWYGARYWALVFSQLTLLATNVIAVWLLCRWRPGKPRRNSGVRSMLTFGGNITGYALINYFSKNSDNLLIGRFWGPQALGFYNKAAQLVGLPTDQVNEPLASVSIPALSRLSDEPERYRQAYLRIMEKVMLLTMPAVTLMIAAADWLVLIVLGPQWTEATKILIFISIAGLFQPIASTIGWLFVSQGRGQDMLRWSVINAPLSLLGIGIGLPWGASGVAASYAATKLLLMNPLIYWYVGRKGPVRTFDFYRVMAPFAVASAVSLLACFAFRSLIFVTNPITGFLVSGVIVGLTTLIVLFLIPSGRAAIWDLKRSLLLLKPANTPTAVEPG